MTMIKRNVLVPVLFALAMLIAAGGVLWAEPAFADDGVLRDGEVMNCKLSQNDWTPITVTPGHTGLYAIVSSQIDSNGYCQVETQLLNMQGQDINTGEKKFNPGQNMLVIGELNVGPSFTLMLNAAGSDASFRLTLVKYGTEDFTLLGDDEITVAKDKVCSTEAMLGCTPELPSLPDDFIWRSSDESILEVTGNSVLRLQIDKDRNDPKDMYTWWGSAKGKNAGKALLELTNTRTNLVFKTVKVTVKEDVPEPKPTVKAVSIKSLTAAKKSFTVKWTPKQKNYVTGYKIRYSLKSSMAKSVTKTVKGGAKKSLKVKSLKSKKKYYVQIRAYKKISGKTYYSSWSKKKSVKVK